MAEKKSKLNYQCTFPSMPLMAAEASSLDVKVTNPNPLDLPVSLSMITLAAEENIHELVWMQNIYYIRLVKKIITCLLQLHHN